MPILKPLSRRAAIAAASIGTGIMCYSFHSYRKYNSQFERSYRNYLSNCEQQGIEPISKNMYSPNQHYFKQNPKMLEAAYLGPYWISESRSGGGRGGYSGM